MQSRGRASAQAGLTLLAAATLVLGGAGVSRAATADQTTTTTAAKSDSSAKSATADKSSTTTTTASAKPGGGKSAKTGKGATGPTGGPGSLNAYGVAVSGQPAVSAQPVLSLSACPDTKDATVPGVDAAPVRAGTVVLRADCTKDASGNVVRSRADVSDLSVGSGTTAVSAVRVTAACVANAQGAQGTAVFDSLKLAGKAVEIPAEVAANTPLSQFAKGFTGVVNMQTTTGAKLGVTALVVTVDGAEISVGHVECDANLGSVEAVPVAQPASVTTVPAKFGPVTSKPAKVEPAAGAKGGKDLPKTGSMSTPLLLLATGALALGLLMRVGTDGLAVLVPARYRRRRGATPAASYRPAQSWTPRNPGR